MTYYMGIDPGSSRAKFSHTGVVVLHTPSEGPAALADDFAVPGGIEGFRKWANSNMWMDLADIVIVETFVDRQVRGADRTPMLIEGAVRFLRPDAILSPASGYKSAVPDEVLKKFDLWFTGDHHNDRRSSARHLLRYLRKHHLPTAEAGWGWIKEKT